MKSEAQKAIIKKFKQILKEFPERIIISQVFKTMVYYPFFTDEPAENSRLLDEDDDHEELVQRRLTDSNDDMKDTHTMDFNEANSQSIDTFLDEERLSALDHPILEHESQIITENTGTSLSHINDAFSHKKFYTVKTKQIEWIDDHMEQGNQWCLDDQLGTKSLAFMHIFIDTTNFEKLKTEQTMRKYQKLMLSSVAHEFRNPLNAIKGNLELIETFKLNTIEKYIRISLNSCMMLNSYVEDILDLGRIHGNAFHLNNNEFDLESLCSDVLSMFELELSHRRIECQINISDDLKNSIIVSDKDRLRQVMVNLLSNAIKFWKSKIKISWFTHDHSLKFEESKSNWMRSYQFGKDSEQMVIAKILQK